LVEEYAQMPGKWLGVALMPSWVWRESKRHVCICGIYQEEAWGRKDSNLRAETGQRAVEVLKAKAKLSKQLIAVTSPLPITLEEGKRRRGGVGPVVAPLYLIYYPQLHAILKTRSGGS